MASEHDRRLAEYERQVDDLQGQLKGLEEEVVVLRRRLQDAPEAGPHARGEDPRDQGPARSRPSPRTNASPPPSARRASTSPRCGKRSRSSRCRRPPTAPSSAPTTTAPSTSSPPAARCASRCTPRSSVDAIVRGQEVALNESLNVVLARGAEISGEVVILKEVLESKDRALIVGRADEERVCELGGVAARREAARRRPPPHGRPLRPARRAHPPARGRGAGARRGPRRHLRRRRRPRRPDRCDQGRGRAPVPLRRAVPRARAPAAEGHPALRPARAAARRSSPRRSPTRSRSG